MNKESRRLYIAALLIFLISFTIYIAFNLKDHFWIGDFKALRGDESDYLIVTKSIVQDHDLELENNYMNPRPEITKANWTWHAVQGVGGHLYSAHGIGLPIMISPFYFLGGIFGTKIFVSLITSVINVLIFLILISLNKNWFSAVLCSLIIGFASPILTLSTHLSSDVPMALFTCIVFYLILRDSMNSQSLFLMGILMGFSPFLKSAYAIFGVVVLLYVITYAYRHKCLKDSTYFLIPYLALTILYGYYQYHAFGSFFTTPQPYSYGDLVAGSLGLLFDRRFGLLVYSPIIYFSIFGVDRLLKEKRRELVFGVCYFASLYILVSSYSSWWGGWTQPARLIVPVIPLLIVPLHYFISNLPKSKLVRLAVSCSAIYSFLVNGVILWLHAFSRNEITGLPFTLIRRLTGYDLQFLLPVFTEGGNIPTYTVVTIIILVTVVLLYCHRAERHRTETSFSDFVAHT